MKYIPLTFALFAGLSVCFYSLKDSSSVGSSLFMLNVEALSQGEDRLYEKRDEVVTEIIDDESGVQRKQISIVCEGIGNLPCP